MEREALKLALEAYLCREMPAGTIIGDPKWWVPKIAAAIKAALAQPAQEPEQEPVAWMSEHRFDELRKGFTVMTTLTKRRVFEDDVAIYTTPPKRERVVFPTMLRKMWSGGEVQAWLDENVNKEKSE